MSDDKTTNPLDADLRMRMAVQNPFRLQCMEDHSNVIMLGTVGLDKTHLATALGYTACLAGKSVLFATAVDTINTLAAAQAASRLKVELKKHLAPYFPAYASECHLCASKFRRYPSTNARKLGFRSGQIAPIFLGMH